MQQELLLAAIVLLAVAVLAWWFLPRKAQRLAPQKVQRLDPKKAQREFLHRLAQGGDPGLPHQKAQRIDSRIEHEFNRLFMTTTKEGKEALIERWMARQKCGRLEAMRLAVEEWRRENR